jgi:superfamily II DNA or RNA helicase
MTTIIEIGRGIKCINTPKEARKRIEKDLTIDNPAYTKAIKLGKYTSADPSLILYDSEKTTYWMPRGYVFFLIKFLKRINHPYKIVEKTKTFEPLNFKFYGKLRKYQSGAESHILKYPIGVLEAGTGSGKTVSALSIIAKRKQPTLIFVHTKELLYQWQDRVKQFLKEDVGIIGDGKFEIKNISVGTIQTIKKRLDELTPHFGFLIIDEVHRYATMSGIFTIQDFPAKYYLGLTATPFRSDGLGKLIFMSIGPKIHIVNKKNLFDTKAILRPDIFRIDTNFRYIFNNDYSSMMSILAKDEQRNQLICKKTSEDLKIYDDAILLVSDRKIHVKILQEMLLSEYGIKSIVLTGTTKKKQRTEYIQEINKKKVKVILATTSLIGEGFDAPYLTALFLTMPIKFSGRLIQASGRILRPEKNKIPRLYDFRDNNIDVLRYSGYARDKVYRKEWQ